MTDTSKMPTVARIWCGRTSPERADEYEMYNYEVGIKPLIEKALGVHLNYSQGRARGMMACEPAPPFDGVCGSDFS